MLIALQYVGTTSVGASARGKRSVNLSEKSIDKADIYEWIAFMHT